MSNQWGGRFREATDASAYKFNQSISFDRRMYREDIEGSIAHATMLGKQGIISEEESCLITDGLKKIREDIESGVLIISDEAEDIHSFIESVLTERIGDAGKKLHTGRSRNDQVALDMKLYTKEQVKETDTLLLMLQKELLSIMEANIETYMPGFTHLQKAQPVTLAHHFGAYFEMFKGDRLRLKDIYHRMNY